MRTTKVRCSRRPYSISKEHEYFADVELPDGHRRVWTGALKPGDLHLHMTLINDGIVHWVPAEMPTMEDARKDAVYSRVKWFACIIRPDGEDDIEKPCERCQCEPRWKRDRFCIDCGYAVIEEAKAAHK